MPGGCSLNLLFTRSNRVAASLLSYPALTFPWQMLWETGRAFAANVGEQLLWMNGCSASGPTLPSAIHPALTSQSIQLSHPTVLILLGNDLKNRDWKTLVEKSAAPGGLQLPSCVYTMRNCFLLNCFASVLFSHGPGPSRAKSYCKHNVTPVFPQLLMGSPQLKHGTKVGPNQPFAQLYGSQERDLVVALRMTHKTTLTGTPCLIPGSPKKHQLLPLDS